jgi:glycolate oxidase
VAENAGGLRGLKYGVTKDYVMGVDFFDVDGGLVKSGSRTVKCVTGYNLGGLMIASEGTLGVFAEITLKLVPPPAAQKAMMAIYDNVDKASESVAAIIANKIVPCTLEFLDNATIRYVEDFCKAGLPTDAQAVLLIEVDGHPVQVEEDAAKVVELCKKVGASEVKMAEDAAQRDALWTARRAALPALARARPTTVLEDATVPRSKIPAMIKAINEIAAKYKLDIGTFGHAGDGNLHPTIMCDRRDKEEFHRVEAAVDEIFDVAISLKGTLSGEHGIGLAKSKWMEKETSRATIEYSRRMKKSIDPKSILNPGKIIAGRG